MAEIFRQRGECRKGLPGRGAPSDLDGAEAGFLKVKDQEGRREGMAVGGIQIEVSGENGEALRIGSFDEKTSVPSQDARGETEEVGEAMGRQMFDHLSAEQAVERGVRLRWEPVEQVGCLSGKTLAAAEGDGLFAEVHTVPRDAGFAEELEKFAATAAEIRHGLTTRKVREVKALLRLDEFLAAPETIGEF